ncbi:MAG: periplasmic heavy metal sensor [Deltaproteobacteria bacterium]|nr:periplasmic heavy metal sensor [Deltaproteobacteria bacterium]MBW2445156.1 periplasmic heavy metal sensor [Deltaproteobacteria bacterium]
MRRSSLTLATLAWLAITGIAEARPPHGPMGAGPPPGAMLDFHADELGLDEDTRETIREIVEESHTEGRALHGEVREAREALHRELKAEPVDHDAVMALVERAGALETEMEKHRIETMLEIRDQLSPEQRTALVELRGRMRDLHVKPILDACEADAEALCEAGNPRAIHCLMRQRGEVSEQCAAALDGLPRRFGRGHEGEGHGPPRFGPGR